MTQRRCEWAGDGAMLEYHDREWGAPVHDDRTLFEFLILEGAQAGLSWATILKKRAAYRAAFDAFDVAKVAAYGQGQVEALLADAGIVRNRRKIESAIGNARAFLEVRREFGAFDAYLWGFVGGKPLRNRIQAMSEIPATTETSDRLSADLKSRGFKFVGSTICYAYMQSVGLVNDHATYCFRYDELA